MCRASGGRSPNLDELLSPINLASGGFLAVPPLISKCSNVLFGTQERSWRLESCLQETGDKRPPCLGAPQGPTRIHSHCKLQRILAYLVSPGRLRTSRGRIQPLFLSSSGPILHCLSPPQPKCDHLICQPLKLQSTLTPG